VKLTKQQKDDFHQNGFLIIRDFYSESEIQLVKDEINLLGKNIVKNDFNLDKKFNKKLEKKYSLLYKVLRYSIMLNKMSVLDKNILLTKQLGVKIPSVMKSCNIRMDTPSNKKLFQWHQDTSFLLGSLNALTFWIPLTDVNKKMGSVEVIPESHKKGFYKYKITKTNVDQKSFFSPSDLHLIDEPKNDNNKIITAKSCDLVVFYQMLLHRSTNNNSENNRYVMQLRYSDLLNKEFIDSDYPYGDNTNILFTNYKNNTNKGK